MHIYFRYCRLYCGYKRSRFIVGHSSISFDYWRYAGCNNRNGWVLEVTSLTVIPIQQTFWFGCILGTRVIFRLIIEYLRNAETLISPVLNESFSLPLFVTFRSCFFTLLFPFTSFSLLFRPLQWKLCVLSPWIRMIRGFFF